MAASSNPGIPVDEMKMTNRIMCFQRKQADGCFALGNMFSQIDDRGDKAAKLYQHTCETYNHGPSCFYLSNYFFFARGELRKDTKKFLEYAKKGCQYQCAGACMLLAAFFHPAHTRIPFRDDSDMKMKDFSKTVDYYEKACQMNNSEGCVKAGSAYLYGATNLNFDKNEAKALPYFIKACENGEGLGCALAYRQYKDGLGVQADQKLAELYSAKYENINREKKRQ
ncbi:uncharacterized protein LOC110456015 [Mizuhopecten yessoensis]|nr:uncharacterized protein LOC110456015 [Mizuhopecten yessoensis]